MGRGVPNWMTGLSFGAVGDVVAAAPVVAVVDVGAALGGIKIIHFQKKIYTKICTRSYDEEKRTRHGTKIM